MKKELLPKDRILLVIGLPDTLRDPFVEGLRSRNCDFVAVRAGQETKLIDENDAEVNFSDLNGVKNSSQFASRKRQDRRRSRKLCGQRRPIGAIRLGASTFRVA